jgi:hypothetical protein
VNSLTKFLILGRDAVMTLLTSKKVLRKKKENRNHLNWVYFSDIFALSPSSPPADDSQEKDTFDILFESSPEKLQQVLQVGNLFKARVASFLFTLHPRSDDFTFS